MYQQVDGTPMGSSISELMVEAVLQRLELLRFQRKKPKFWFMYLDDTFLIIETDWMLTFKERLDAVYLGIQFTKEEEEENKQPAFLDVLVCRKVCSDLKTEVFKVLILIPISSRTTWSCTQTSTAITSEKLEGCPKIGRPNMRQQCVEVTPNLKSLSIRRDDHTLKFVEAGILAKGDDRVSRELLEPWLTGPQSMNKCNHIPTPYSELRHSLAKVTNHSGNAQTEASGGRTNIPPASNTDDESSAINN
ncbi:hypothetical protein SprV_0100438800 [Sparganum proliferum]